MCGGSDHGVSTHLGAPVLGPSLLVLLRHGESVGNVADRQAREQRVGRLDLKARDADVELSPTGCEQADAIGRYLAELPESACPTVMLTSPYARAADTAARALAASGLSIPCRADERLRERELGVFDGLTSAGVREEYPEEAERRQRLGKFYYRPPGGESWADVVLRVRGVLADVGGWPSSERLWVFTHQAVITCFRYLLEGLSEAQILDIDGSVPVPNGSTTTYRRGPAGFPQLVEYAATAAVEVAGAEPTREPEHAGQGSEV